MCGGQTGAPGPPERAKPQEVSMLKTPKTIGLLAVPVVLAAAVISASGAFAKAPAHQSAATAPTTAPSAAQTPATEPATEPADAAEPAGTETNGAAEPADAETNDAAGGHADDPNDSNADHQFNGEE